MALVEQFCIKYRHASSLIISEKVESKTRELCLFLFFPFLSFACYLLTLRNDGVVSAYQKREEKKKRLNCLIKRKKKKMVHHFLDKVHSWWWWHCLIGSTQGKEPCSHIFIQTLWFSSLYPRSKLRTTFCVSLFGRSYPNLINYLLKH